MGSLSGTVAVVTGASRGIGKGIALGLGEAGATVYVTGRSTDTSPASLPGTIDETAADVTRRGGTGIAVRCDHRVDGEVVALFDRIREEQGRVDVLVNNAFASPEQRVQWGGQRFWEIRESLWDELINVGLRSHFIASRCVVPMMIARGRGLILNVSSRYALSGKTGESAVVLPYSVGKAGLHRLSSDMAVELHDYGVAVIEILPPATTTEGVLAQADTFGDLSAWKPPLFTGRVVAAFLASEDPASRSGEPLLITDLADEFAIDDAANS